VQSRGGHTKKKGITGRRGKGKGREREERKEEERDAEK